MRETEQTALVVLNFQNQFTDKQCALYYKTTAQAVPVIADGIREHRERVVLVVYANS